MELLELVDNEPTSRPFACDWSKCGKSFNRKSDLQRHYRIHTNERPYACNHSGCGKSFIQRSALTVHTRTHTGEKPHQCQHNGCGKRFSDSSSLARHRRIHTGKRPYKCAHSGCTKSFCRKTTMVKHQRRSHQRGIHSQDMEESMSETGSEGSPATPKSVVMQWPMSMVNLPRAATFADFGHHMNGYNVQQPYQHRHSMSGQPYNHRHSMSGDGAHEYPGMPQHQAPMAPHEQPQQQHPGVHMLQRTASLPQGYFVPEQNNPGVATMNTNTHPANAQMHPQYQQAPRQGVERLPLEMPPYSSAPGLSGSLHSSPSPYSPSSGRSPAAQDGFYTHAPTAQAATYALHTASPVEQQQPQVVNYQGQIASQQPVISPPTQPPAVQQPPQQQPQAVPEPYAQQHGQAETQQWYNGVAYQPPVTIELPGYGPSVYDWDGPKIEYADPSMQLPSDRIANM